MTSGLTLEFSTGERPAAAATAAPAVRSRAAAMRVRPLQEDDLEPVADLFLQRFRKSRRTPRARAEVAARMKALYLDQPTRQGDPDALVAIDPAGGLAAFCGGMRARFSLDGRPVTGCITGTLMASPAPGHALSAVQILRESRKLDYDFIMTDSANRASLAMCQAIGYSVVSPDSLEWAAVFAPAGLALHKLRQRLEFGALGALRPLARGFDLAAAAALRAATGPAKRSDWRDEEVDAETFVEIAPRFYEPFALRPDFARADFLWLIAMAKRRRSAGPLRLRVLYDGSGAPAGAYAAFAAKGGVARVIHCVAAPNAWGRLFDHIRDAARAWGCIGAHGPMKAPMLPHAYAARGVLFYYAGGSLLYSNREDVRRAVAGGGALLGGFAGDRWTELASDAFG
jgi:hypothetical protein